MKIDYFRAPWPGLDRLVFEHEGAAIPFPVIEISQDCPGGAHVARWLRDMEVAELCYPWTRWGAA